jgi:hypothetical protein
MKGKALVQLMNVDIQAGTSLVIPETANIRRKCGAKLLAFQLGRKHHPNEREDLVEAMKADAVVILKPFAGTQPFVFDGHENLCIVSVDDIEAWSPDAIDLTDTENSDGAVPRCKWCGPARPEKSTNAMLMVEGPEGYYCPRCMMDKHGKVVDPDAVTLSEQEEEEIAMELERRKRGTGRVTVGYKP